LQVGEDELGRALFEALDNARRVGAWRGPDQQMKMFGHQYVADDLEIELDAQLGQGSDEVAAETQGIKKLRAPVGAGGDKMQMVTAVVLALQGLGGC
jgi:hypothetical protein